MSDSGPLGIVHFDYQHFLSSTIEEKRWHSLAYHTKLGWGVGLTL